MAVRAKDIVEAFMMFFFAAFLALIIAGPIVMTRTETSFSCPDGYDMFESRCWKTNMTLHVIRTTTPVSPDDVAVGTGLTVLACICLVLSGIFLYVFRTLPDEKTLPDPDVENLTLQRREEAWKVWLANNVSYAVVNGQKKIQTPLVKTVTEAELVAKLAKQMAMVDQVQIYANNSWCDRNVLCESPRWWLHIKPF